MMVTAMIHAFFFCLMQPCFYEALHYRTRADSSSTISTWVESQSIFGGQGRPSGGELESSIPAAVQRKL